jgi:proton-coupled amino acid transporter
MSTKVTYPVVGEFFYGRTFENYVAACVCTQQLAICTVFISFVGENVLAILQRRWNMTSFPATHAGVMIMELPFLIGLAMIPNLRQLSPIMATGTILLMVTFVAIGVIMFQVWPKDYDTQPYFSEAVTNDDHHHSAWRLQNWTSVPLALSAILYSYEGINLILPVESAMAQPQTFHIPFVLAMMCVALILASFAILCVLAFGKVTNASITAFLLHEYPKDPDISWWIMVANIAVSGSVLLTYPIQLFPALELVAPSFSKFCQPEVETDIDDQQDHDLSAFEPLPPLPEHDVPDYDDGYVEENIERAQSPDTTMDRIQVGTRSGTFRAIFASIHSMMMTEITIPGDTPTLRILLVLLTFLIAVIVPNVQSLISLAGALAGSSSALLIPPLLELAWIQHLESTRTCNNSNGCTNRQGRDDQGNGQEANTRITERSLSISCVDERDLLTVRNAWRAKFKCYLLLSGGIIFFVVGTWSSLADIVRIYSQKE